MRVTHAGEIEFDPEKRDGGNQVALTLPRSPLSLLSPASGAFFWEVHSCTGVYALADSANSMPRHAVDPGLHGDWRSGLMLTAVR